MRHVATWCDISATCGDAGATSADNKAAISHYPFDLRQTVVHPGGDFTHLSRVSGLDGPATRPTLGNLLVTDRCTE